MSKLLCAAIGCFMGMAAWYATHSIWSTLLAGIIVGAFWPRGDE